MYERIAAELREQIITGQSPAGGQLPTQAELELQHGYSRAVVRRALDLLESEGLIDRRQGEAAYVRRNEPLVRRPANHYRNDPGEPFASETIAAQRTPTSIHHSRIVPVAHDIAVRLDIQPHEPVMRTDYTSFIDGRPAMFVSSYENLALTKDTAIEWPGEGPYAITGLVGRFTEIARRPTRAFERLHARMPRPDELEVLRLPRGIPVVVIVRTTMCGETVLETADMLLAGNLVELEYEITPP